MASLAMSVRSRTLTKPPGQRRRCGVGECRFQLDRACGGIDLVVQHRQRAGIEHLGRAAGGILRHGEDRGTALLPWLAPPPAALAAAG